MKSLLSRPIHLSCTEPHVCTLVIKSVWASLRSGRLFLNVERGGLNSQFSNMVRFCTLSSHLLSTVEILYIYEDIFQHPYPYNDIGTTRWLELVRPSVAVKNLFLSERSAQRIESIIREPIGGEMTKMLPAF